MDCFDALQRAPRTLKRAIAFGEPHPFLHDSVILLGVATFPQSIDAGPAELGSVAEAILRTALQWLRSGAGVVPEARGRRFASGCLPLAQASVPLDVSV
jgi:hypothetical protein